MWRERAEDLNWTDVTVRNVCSPSEMHANHLSLNFICACATLLKLEY